MAPQAMVMNRQGNMVPEEGFMLLSPSVSSGREGHFTKSTAIRATAINSMAMANIG